MINVNVVITSHCHYLSSEKQDNSKVMPPNMIYRSTELSFEGLKALFKIYFCSREFLDT